MLGRGAHRVAAGQPQQKMCESCSKNKASTVRSPFMKASGSKLHSIRHAPYNILEVSRALRTRVYASHKLHLQHNTLTCLPVQSSSAILHVKYKYSFASHGKLTKAQLKIFQHLTNCMMCLGYAVRLEKSPVSWRLSAAAARADPGTARRACAAASRLHAPALPGRPARLQQQRCLYVQAPPGAWLLSLCCPWRWCLRSAVRLLATPELPRPPQRY